MGSTTSRSQRRHYGHGRDREAGRSCNSGASLLRDVGLDCHLLAGVTVVVVVVVVAIRAKAVPAITSAAAVVRKRIKLVSSSGHEKADGL